MVKRLVDVLVSLIALLILSPLLLLLYVLVRLDSPGPGFYRATRVGKDGHVFKMFKFRTMVVDADRIGPTVTYRNDPRITRLGATLRDVRLDELPQLINVLRGEMSLVGPRPESPEYVSKYTADQKRILDVKPGVTGLMQLKFLDEEESLSGPDTLDEKYLTEILPMKLATELEYIEKQSLLLDLKMMLRTVWVLLVSQ